MSGDLTPTELRVKVAEAMGYSDINPDGRMWGERDDGFVECMTGYTNRDGVKYGPFEVPNFGARDWSATGAVLDEIERIGGVWHKETDEGLTTSVDVSLPHPGRYGRRALDNGTNFHRAICLAFLEAHARAKEPK